MFKITRLLTGIGWLKPSYLFLEYFYENRNISIQTIACFSKIY